MEKYGFVYIWRDRKHKRYYIGCHWGREDDGYVCSSKWMKNAYKIRPEDFKRRILCRVETRTEALQEEGKWLALIKPEELKVRYYNSHNHAFNHWSSNPDQLEQIRRTLSEKTKEAMARPEVREKMEAVYAKERGKKLDPEFVAARTEKIKEGWEKASPPQLRFHHAEFGSEEHKQRLSDAQKRIWANPEHKTKMARKSSERQKGVPKLNIRDLKWWNNGTVNVRRKECPGPEWMAGRFKTV